MEAAHKFSFVKWPADQT